MKYTYKDLKHEFKLLFDSYDPWGTTMHWWFVIADSLTFTHERNCPEHWQFQPSPFGPYNEPGDSETEMANNADPDDLERFGNLLCRYAGLLRRAGHNY